MPADEEINTLLVMLRLSGAIVVILLTWLVVSPSTTVDATSAVTSVPLPNGVMVDDLAVATGSDGLPQIAYYDGTNGDLGFVRCLDPYCATYEQRTLDSAGSVGEYPAIVTGEADRPIIAYRDANADGRYISRLKVARCLDDDCNDWSFSYPDIRTFNDVIDAGYGIDMLVDGEILYISHGSKDPDVGTRLVYCDLLTCDGGTEVAEAFAVQTRVNRNPANGFAVISYLTTDGGIGTELCKVFFCAVRTSRFPAPGNTTEFDARYDSNYFYVARRNGSRGLLMGSQRFDPQTGAPADSDRACCSLPNLDNVGPTGFSPALLFGKDGLPVVTYVSGDPAYRDGQMQVRRFECQIPSCAAPNTIRFLGSAGSSAGQVVDAVESVSGDGTKRHVTVWARQEQTGGILQIANCPVSACGEIPPYPLIHSLNVNMFTVPSTLITPMQIWGQGFAESARLLVGGEELDPRFHPINPWSIALVAPYGSMRYGNLRVEVENSPLRKSPPAFFNVGTISGNVNCDNYFDAADALWLMRRLADLELPTPGCVPEDVDSDGDLTLLDVIAVRRATARLQNLPTIYPPWPW